MIGENPSAPGDQQIHRAGIDRLCTLLQQPLGFFIFLFIYFACIGKKKKVGTDPSGVLTFPEGLTVTGIPCHFHDPLHPCDTAITMVTERIRAATRKLAKVEMIRDRHGAFLFFFFFFFFFALVRLLLGQRHHPP